MDNLNHNTEYICYGPKKPWDTETTKVIEEQVKAYADRHNLKNACIKSIEDNTWSDPDNQRYDIWIAYAGEHCPIQQKLLFLRGNILDGEEFHTKFTEFYPD